MAPRPCRKLVVFFSRGMSLEGWHQAGILDREIALYRELSDSVDRLAFVTYGGLDELKWAALLPGVEILPNRLGIATNVYSLIAPWLHRKSLRDASVFRTNQINGAWCGVVAKVLFGKPLVVRCGFLWADFVARLSTSRFRRTVTRLIERAMMRMADRIVVAADADASRIVQRYGIDRRRITVIPNYVDTSRFRPLPNPPAERGTMCFIGRLEAQKNLESLLDALRGLPDVRLTVVGDGLLRSALEARARAHAVRAEFIGRVPHSDLPAVLNGSEVFVLPSHYEGNPKALVEAMACGIPVIGARSPGIREIVTHGETGFLCGTSPVEIRSAVLEVFNDPVLRERIRQGGLQYVQQSCSLTLAAERERAILASIVSVA